MQNDGELAISGEEVMRHALGSPTQYMPMVVPKWEEELRKVDRFNPLDRLQFEIELGATLGRGSQWYLVLSHPYSHVKLLTDILHRQWYVTLTPRRKVSLMV
jgi:hypothetical protein